MTNREIILYLSLKFKGDWDEIYKFISDYKNGKVVLDEKEALNTISKNKSKYITIFDENYPECLRQSVKPPFVLYYKGDITLLDEHKHRLAVVGSRKISEYGQEVTDKFVPKLSKDFIIVSGLAIGVDSAAHRACINAKGKTIGVLGNGIDFIYLEDKELYEECSKNHLVLSEYPEGTPAKSDYFPVRNRIIVALCNDLLVVEGKVNSGTQISACLMCHKGGNVYCVPTRINEDSICNKLISEGAFLVEEPNDIYDYSDVVLKKPIFE